MITKVVKMSWYQENIGGKYGECHYVYHDSKSRPWKNRVYCYPNHSNLPMTVVNFLLADDTKCETEYLPDDRESKERKRETFTK